MTTETTLEQYKFHIDSVAPELINGWAFYTDKEEHHPVIEIRHEETVLWQAEANTYRGDLSNAGIGNGEYAFSIKPLRSSLKEQISSVDVYVDGHKVQENISFEMKPVDISEYRAFLDSTSVEEVKGWACNVTEPSHRPLVELRCGEAILAFGIAETFRQDLLNAEIGDGYYAFTLTPRLEKFPTNPCECTLYIDGVAFQSEPIILEAPLDEIEAAKYKYEFTESILSFTQEAEAKLQDMTNAVVNENKKHANEDFHHTGVTQVMMNNIAELSTRIKVIEQVLIKKLI